MYNDQRRGDSWKLNDLRTLLFMHYARESCHSSTAEAPVRKASRLAIVAARLLPSLIALGGVIVFSLVSAVCYAIRVRGRRPHRTGLGAGPRQRAARRGGDAGMDADAAPGDAAGIRGKRVKMVERGGGGLPRPQTSSYPFLG